MNVSASVRLFLMTALLLAACGSPVLVEPLPVTISAPPQRSLPPLAGASASQVLAGASHGAARAFVVESRADLPRGPAAMGELGDLVLRNEALVAVIKRAGRAGRISPGGAGIVDLMPKGATEAFGEAATMLDPDGRALPVFTEVVVARDGRDGGTAIVRATGVDPRDDQIVIEVDYLLESGESRLRVVTTATNLGRGHYRDFVLGLSMSWGLLNPFVPGIGGSTQGRQTKTTWVGADGPSASVVLASSGGLVESISGREFSHVVATRAYLSPGATVVSEALLYVAAGGGVAVAERLMARARHVVTGRIEGLVRERMVPGRPIRDRLVPDRLVPDRLVPDQKDHRPVPGAWVSITERGAGESTRAVTGLDGRFFAEVSSGRYTISAAAPGRGPSSPISLLVESEKNLSVVLELEAESRLDFSVDDEAGRPLGARLRLTGVGGTPTPNLATGAVVLASAGQGQTLVPPGSYRVEVSAGPTYERRFETVRLVVGQATVLKVTLKQAFDPSPLVAVDPYTHTVRSASAIVSPEARIRACAVEGLDVVIAVNPMGSDEQPGEGEKPETTSPFILMTGVERVGAQGRFAVLPLVNSMPAAGAMPAMGAMPAAGAGPSRGDEVIASLHALPGQPPVAVLRPRARQGGYFTQYAFDPLAADLPRGGFSTAFELLHFGPMTGEADLDRLIADAFALLKRGARLVPIAGSGSDDVEREPCGWPRTYLRGPVRSPADVEAAWRRGDVSLSNGPLLEISVGGHGAGGVVGAGGAVQTAGSHLAALRVRSAAWTRPNVIELLCDGRSVRREAIAAVDAALDFRVEWAIPAGARVCLGRAYEARLRGDMRPWSYSTPWSLTGLVRFDETASTP